MGLFTHTEEGKLRKRRPWSIRFSMVNRSAASNKTEVQGSVTHRSASTRKGPTRKSQTTSCLDDEAKWREVRPFLGHQMNEKFKPLKTIGKGQYGMVFEVMERHPARLTNGKVTDEISEQKKPRSYACKVVDILPNDVHDDSLRLEDIESEIKILAGLGGGHPNIQDLVDFAVEGDRAYIVSSLCRGGDLAQALEMRGCLCEEDARNVMAGVLSGLAHLHSRGVVHRDIKLDNILLTESKHDMSKVKIIDMGFAKHLTCPDATRCGETYNNICGTPMYIAPELIRSSVQEGKIQTMARYGTQADMWSCGVVFYCLLSGYLPFNARVGADMIDLFQDIANSVYDFSDPVWETVSEEALDLIKSLLEVDPVKRLTAEEALRHPWMTAGR